MNQKMKKKPFKVLSLIVVFIATFAVCTNVNAKINCASRWGGDNKDNKIIDDFGLNFKKNGSLFTISVNPKSSDKALLKKFRKVKFKVVAIDPAAGNELQLGQEVQYGTPLVLTVAGQAETPMGPGVQVTLTANPNGNGADICSASKASLTVDLYVADYLDSIPDDDTGVTITEEELAPTKQGKKIECDNYSSKYDKTSFEYKFCQAKTEALKKTQFTTAAADDASGNTIVNFNEAFSAKASKEEEWIQLFYDDVVTKKGNLGVTRKFSCNPRVTKTYQQATSGSEDDYYDQNTHYMYGSGTMTFNPGIYYTYHYHNEKPTVGDAVKCSVTCEEAVTVKYGPPVAIRAGACFEYKIKVESRVTCYMSQGPKKPKAASKVCTPTPYCKGHGAIYNQGGPSEDFDACINDCDGGKYTDKCNNKCYNEIYGQGDNNLLSSPTIEKEAKKNSKKNNNKKNNNKKSTVIENTFSDLTASKWKEISLQGNKAKNSKYNGYYYQKSNGTMVWKPYNTKGRWYYFHKWGFNHPYPRIEAGIPRSKYCTDTCWWSSSTCSSTKYINYGLAEYDKAENIKKYNRAVALCEAQTKCTTATAEYTINASYEKPNSETTTIETWIDFPRTSLGKDKLSTCSEENRVNTKAGNIKSTINDYAGCYSQTCDSNNYYMTEWTFPDSWINKKTHEISYETHTYTDGWRQKPNRFCIPLDAGSVNERWSRWYYRHVEKVPEGYYCSEGSGDESDLMQKVNKTNIKGNTTHFGYYKWNIDFSCFYAVDNYHVETSKEDNKGEICTPTTNPDYRIRTVTNNELFPSSTGTSTAAGQTQGREPGYNWTADSALTENVIIPEYVSDPVKVKEYIQKEGNSIYNSDGYVDYEFILTPNDLRRIKEYNKKLSSFDTFCGSLEDRTTSLAKDNSTGITSYRSNLFRSGIDSNTYAECQSVAKNFITPRKQIQSGYLFCNNNDTSGGCNLAYK